MREAREPHTPVGRVRREKKKTQSHSLFSASFQTFRLTARAYLNTQKYGLFCSLAFPGSNATNLYVYFVELFSESRYSWFPRRSAKPHDSQVYKTKIHDSYMFCKYDSWFHFHPRVRSGLSTVYYDYVGIILRINNSEVKESRIIKTTTTIKFRWICVSCKNFGKTGGFHTNWPYPQVELKIFLERKARARNFLCFRRQHTSLSTTFWDPTLLQMGKTGLLARSSCQLPHRNRGTQRQFSEKYLFGRRFEI